MNWKRGRFLTSLFLILLMNEKDARPDYKKLYRSACKFYKKTVYFWFGDFDETFFSMRVFETAKDIISLLDVPVKKSVVLTATILHDIGKSEIDEQFVFNSLSHGKGRMLLREKNEFRTHPKKSVPLAKNVLKRMGHSSEFISEVCYLIEHHDMRGKKMSSRSIELQIMQDADIVSDCGLADLMRIFSFAGQFKRSLIDSIYYAMTRKNRVDEDGNLNLEVSKQLAKEKMTEYWKLVGKLKKELDSELL